MKINPILSYFESFNSGWEREKKKGDFVEYLLYDYFENLGYNVSLCLTKNQNQTIDDSTIPDLLIESYPKYLFFVESKSSWTHSYDSVSVSTDMFARYKRFYQMYPKSYKSNVEDFETKIVFTKFRQISQGGIFSHYFCDIRESLNLSTTNGLEFTWSFSDLEKNCETVRQEVYFDFTWEGNVFTSNYCSDILAKNRYVWTFDEKQMKLLSEGKLSNNKDGW